MKNIELVKLNNKKKYQVFERDGSLSELIGEVDYKYNKNKDYYECDASLDSLEYLKDSLKLLIKKAYHEDIKFLYYNVKNKDEESILLDIGFKYQNKDVMKIKTKQVLFDISNLKTINDVLEFMKNNIRYGWLDINNKIHIGNMKDFRKLYRTLSIEEILEYGIGTCIDQVNLMHYLLNKIKIKNKMFATRIYEPNDYNKMDEEEHMHCFILCYINNKVYHIEHPNWYRIGIYEYKNEKIALKKINNYYIELSKGVSRPITEYYKVDSNISFKEFNNYINNLDISFRKLKDNKNEYLKLYQWCQNKDVYEWFEQRKLTYEEVVKKYKNKLKQKEQDLYIIKSNNIDIGLVQIYKFNKDIKLNNIDNYENIYEFDLFVGEEDYLNKGIGTKIVYKINEMIYSKYYANAIVIRVFKKNIRAIKCYKKCNYNIMKEYIGKDTLGNKEKMVILVKEKSIFLT